MKNYEKSVQFKNSCFFGFRRKIFLRTLDQFCHQILGFCIPRFLQTFDFSWFVCILDENLFSLLLPRAMPRNVGACKAIFSLEHETKPILSRNVGK